MVRKHTIILVVDEYQSSSEESTNSGTQVLKVGTITIKK